MRLPPRLTISVLLALAGAALGATPSQAGPAPGLCHSTTTRGQIPDSFAIDGCFDGEYDNLFLRNTLTLALTPEEKGDVEGGTVQKADFDLAALATRSVAGNELLILPGDTAKLPIGVGAATVGIKGSRHGGFFALATTAATFTPVKTEAVVEAFTGMIKELDDDFAQYQNCLQGKNWISQLGCRALLGRNVEFAVARAAVNGLAKGAIAALLAAGTFSKWANAQVPDVRKVLNSAVIRLGVDPSPQLTTTKTCADWYAASFDRRKELSGTVVPGITLTIPVPSVPHLRQAFMYGYIFGNCDRAKQAGQAPDQTALTRVIAGDFVPKSTGG